MWQDYLDINPNSDKRKIKIIMSTGITNNTSELSYRFIFISDLTSKIHSGSSIIKGMLYARTVLFGIYYITLYHRSKVMTKLSLSNMG